MRARINKQPKLQATSGWYGTRTVLQHTPENKRRDYGSRELQAKADESMRELNKLFDIN
jgi:hypothetical protein